MLWETVISLVKVGSITVSKLVIFNLTSITSSLYHSTPHLKHLDFTKMHKLQTRRMKPDSCSKPFNLSNQEQLLQPVRVEKKSLNKSHCMWKRELLLHGLLKTFTKSIPHCMRKVWIQSWYKSWSGTINFLNLWLKRWKMPKRLSKVWLLWVKS